MKSIPYGSKALGRLIPIEGSPVDVLNMPKGCAFAPRCTKAMKICLEHQCEEMKITENHSAACWVNIKEAIDKKEIMPLEDFEEVEK